MEGGEGGEEIKGGEGGGGGIMKSGTPLFD